MSKILRATQKLFASSAGAGEIGVFGSFANGSPTTTTDPATIQSLTQFLEGWFGAIIGSDNPAIEDMNALCFLFARQLAYLFQAGIAEWDSGTTYYIGSVVNSSGSAFVSLTDNNLNHAVTDTANWQPFGSGALSGGVRSLSSNTTLSNADNGKLEECDTSGASFTILLPASPSTNFKVSLKDIKGSFGANPLTIDPNGKSLEGLASTYVVYTNYWDRTIYYDGTAYFLM